jgi:hypothetical protein
VSDFHSLEKRLNNIKNNIIYFSELQKKLTKVISNGITTFKVQTTDVDLNMVKNDVEFIRKELQNNFDILEKAYKTVEKEIVASDKMKQVTCFNSDTQAIDLKAAGGNILFIDAGFANILAADINNDLTYIPKLYIGVAVYFRPIDKNTRRRSFPYNFDNQPHKANDTKNSSDYGIVSQWSIWQHLSLNIGLTLGDMSNKDFGNFYNKHSLLIGPAYRFARAFKISSGIALLKRSSTNPLISDKSIATGGYLSLSVDIDFIQSIKDATNYVFK